MAQNAPKRDPREPTPIVLMNPELRVRQLRYAANIEATLMVPLGRYYEVLLDLSVMGLEYLKSMKLERAFIIFKRIEYFYFHRLHNHPGFGTFTSAAKTKITGRIPMIMYVAQQIIVDFVMPVYERQAAYFRYEELQRRLKLLNPTAWQAITAEACRREAEFYSEAEKISTRFGVELSSFLPQEVVPDDNHPSNYPPRTYPVGNQARGSRQNMDDASIQTALTMAINAMNMSAQTMTISGEQPIESLVRSINAMMNDALQNFFNARNPSAVRISGPSHNELAEINHPTSPDDEVVYVRTEIASNRRSTYSPRVDHMYQVPVEHSQNAQAPPTDHNSLKNPFEYNPTLSLETYVELLVKTFEANSAVATGYRVLQTPAKTCSAGYTLKLEFVAPAIANEQLIFPEPDPGPPRVAPPTQPLAQADAQNVPTTENFGIWVKRGNARGPEGMGSLGVLSELDRAREVLDSVPPMPDGIQAVGGGLPMAPTFFSVVEDAPAPQNSPEKAQTVRSSSSEEIDVLSVDPPVVLRKRGIERDSEDVRMKRMSFPTNFEPGAGGSS